MPLHLDHLLQEILAQRRGQGKGVLLLADCLTSFIKSFKITKDLKILNLEIKKGIYIDSNFALM